MFKYLKIGIISGYYPNNLFCSQINHKCYADHHNYHYIFNSSADLYEGYFFKIATIRRYLKLFDYIFWIDNDAFFTNFNVSLDKFIFEDKLVICKSPSTKKLFTKFSSGQFLIKNTKLSEEFLDELHNVNLNDVKKNWREDLGYFSNGDQDAMVFLSETPKYKDYFHIIDHNNFNNRDYEYNNINDHFLIHFVGGQKKYQAKKEFDERINANKFLVPDEIIKKYKINYKKENELF